MSNITKCEVCDKDAVGYTLDDVGLCKDHAPNGPYDTSEKHKELTKAFKRLMDFGSPWSITSRRSGFSVDVWPGVDVSYEGVSKDREYGIDHEDSLAKTINAVLDKLRPQAAMKKDEGGTNHAELMCKECGQVCTGSFDLATGKWIIGVCRCKNSKEIKRKLLIQLGVPINKAQGKI